MSPLLDSGNHTPALANMASAVKDMYYPAMSQFDVTPYTPTTRLLTGHFRETSGYRAFRPDGVADWLLVYTLSGSGRFGHAGGDLLTTPGDWVVLRPGTRHDYGVPAPAGSWELLWAHFQPRSDWMDLLTWPEVAPGLCHLNFPDTDAITAFRNAHAFRSGSGLHSERLAMNAMEAALLHCAARLPAIGTTMDHRIQRAITHIDEHIATPLTIPALAEIAALSPSRFAHLFTEVTTQSPQLYIETRRMHAAADMLLRTGFPIKQVAASVGFESPFYFSRRFSRFMGQSPLDYRRRNAGVSDPSAQ
jgi:AraC family transcriptional regulator of arabinose operon